MKFSYIICISLLLILSPIYGFSQKTFTAQEYALVLSNRMKDSLRLSDIEYEAVFEINRTIQADIIKTHQQFGKGDREILKNKIIEVEKTRDARYQKVLADDKFKLYQTKKANLFKIK